MADNTTADGPIILALETASTCSSVALVKPGQLLAEYSLDTSATHSRHLLPGVAWLMRECELTWQEISAIAVSLGPGSFTGLRIGLSSAKGMAMAAGSKLIGVPTLDSLAAQLPFSTLPICAVLDARKKEIYAAFYRYNPTLGSMERTTDYRALPPRELAAEINEPTLFVGDGSKVYGELFREVLGERYLAVPPELFGARAAVVGKVALDLHAKGHLMEPATLTPIYVRKSEAELNLGRAGK